MGNLRVYVAASALEIERARAAMAALRAAGVRVTSTWIASIEAAGASNPRDASPEQRRAWSMSDLAEIRAADVLWLLAPAATAPTRGAWTELGFMYALGRRIVCSGDTRQSIFCALGEEYDSDEHALAAIVELACVADPSAAPIHVDEIEAAKHRLRAGPFAAVYPEDIARAKERAVAEPEELERKLEEQGE